jgi:hypothetical protein
MPFSLLSQKRAVFVPQSGSAAAEKLPFAPAFPVSNNREKSAGDQRNRSVPHGEPRPINLLISIGKREHYECGRIA